MPTRKCLGSSYGIIELIPKKIYVASISNVVGVIVLYQIFSVKCCDNYGYS